MIKKEVLLELQKQNPFIFDEIFFRNVYKTGEELKDKIVLDIGANVGIFSIAAIHYGTKKVYSYEPFRSNFDVLTNNISMLENSHPELKGRISALNRAITFDKRSISMTGSEGEATVSGLGNIESDTILEAARDANVLKIDCEGSEYEILFNVDGNFIRRFDIIYAEFHGKYLEALSGYLEFFGFDKVSVMPLLMWDINEKGEPVNHRKIGIETIKFVRK